MINELLPMETTSLWLKYHRNYNHKIRRTCTAITLYVDDDGPFLFIEYNGCGRRPSKREMKKRLMEAWHFRNHRPFGDEYTTPDGYVSYLNEIVL